MTLRARLFAAVLALSLEASGARAAYSPATTNGWFIVAGRTLGFGGAQFLTDIWLFNPDAANNATVTLTLHPQVSSGAPASMPIASTPITLGPRETKDFADLLLATLQANNMVGSLEWNSDLPLLGGLRSYTAPGSGGTFGAFLPAIPITESLTAKQSPTDSANVLQLFGTNSGNTNYRTQLDVTNTSPDPLVVEVRVIDPVNATIYGGVQTFTIAGKSLLRVGRIIENVGAPVVHGLRITVAVREGQTISSGGILAVASTLDNRSQDQYAFVGQRQSGTILPADLLPVEEGP